MVTEKSIVVKDVIKFDIINMDGIEDVSMTVYVEYTGVIPHVETEAQVMGWIKKNGYEYTTFCK